MKIHLNKFLPNVFEFNNGSKMNKIKYRDIEQLIEKS